MEAARPAGKPDHGLEASVPHTADLAVAAVVHPYLAVAEPGRVRTRQASADGLACGAREHHAAAVDAIVPVARSCPCRTIRRGREERALERRAGRDRVELEVVAGQVRSVVALDRA